MNDRIRRMYSEAQDRLHDADLLASSLDTHSDSQTMIRILALEVLLKGALLVTNQEPKQTHNYKNLWLGLPGCARKEILAVASARMTSGCQWRMLPSEFPKWRTVHAYFAKWSEPGPDGFSVLERALKKCGWRGSYKTGAQILDELFDRRRAERQEHR